MITFVNSSVGLLIQKLQQFVMGVTVQWLVVQVKGSHEERTAERTLPTVQHRGIQQHIVGPSSCVRWLGGEC